MKGNPFKQETLKDAWDSGYLEARKQARLQLKEVQEDIGFEHPDCEDCTHQITQRTSIRVMFQLDYIGDEPSPEQFAEELATAIPEEWWEPKSQADWGVIVIMPLDDEGLVIKKT